MKINQITGPSFWKTYAKKPKNPADPKKVAEVTREVERIQKQVIEAIMYEGSAKPSGRKGRWNGT